MDGRPDSMKCASIKTKRIAKLVDTFNLILPFDLLEPYSTNTTQTTGPICLVATATLALSREECYLYPYLYLYRSHDGTAECPKREQTQ